MARKTYSEQELLGKTKLGLRDICNELGIAFDNGKSIEELVKMILKQQGKGGGGGHTADNDDDDDDGDTTGNVIVTCGASSQVLQVAGKSIAYVRREYSVPMNIGRESKAMLNGVEKSDESHILEDEDNLEFVKKSGNKAN